jgi:maltose alpha-D-glucosyltransferase/alpha-amylase
MADSLVKYDDEQKNGTAAIWRNIRTMIDTEYPHAALVSEWGNPSLSLKAGFHMDFLLDHYKSGYRSLVRDYTLDSQLHPFSDNSFFKKNGKGDIRRFLDQYLPWYENTKNDGYISLITGNHDTGRISGNLSPTEIALAYALIFTFPGVPFLYYGDEIGMRYLPLPTKEGGYTRTGSRTPMQWSSGRNAGFSGAEPDQLYLPVDSAQDAPTVADQEVSIMSLLNTVKALLKLRHNEPDLQARPNLEIVYAEKEKLPFIYRRNRLILAVNPSGQVVSTPVNIAVSGIPIYTIGRCQFENNVCIMEAQSFGIWRI